MVFAIVMPAYNEEPRIGQSIAAIRKYTDAEIVVIDDGSTDATREAALRAGATLLRLPFNLGYGAALQTGFKYALLKGYGYALQMDADGQHDPRYINALIEPVIAGACDVAIGSRFLKNSGYRMPLIKRAGAAFLGRFVSLITGQKITDTTSGFKALNKRALRLFAGGAFPSDYPDADIIIMLHKCGMRFAEAPVAMNPNPKEKPMHGGLLLCYYAFKMLLSILVTLLRKEPGCGDREEKT